MIKRKAVAGSGRHKRACSICRHLKCAEIETDFITWHSPAEIAQEYGLSDRSSIYRHAHALGLFAKRQRNIRAALERIIEKAGEVEVTASAVVAAVQAYSKINVMGQWIERSETVDLNQLFDRMTREELEAYAHDGTLPCWFTNAQAGKDPDEAKADAGESVYERLFATMKDGQECGTPQEHRDKFPLPATIPWPKPADFALGNLESRAAARMMAKARAEQDSVEPTLYIAHVDCDQEAYPLYPELQPQDAGTGSSDLPGESLDNPPTPANNSPDIITIEVG